MTVERCPIEICEKTNKLDDSLLRLAQKLDEVINKITDLSISVTKQTVKFEDFDQRCNCLEDISRELSEIRTELAVVKDRQNRAALAGMVGGAGSGGVLVAAAELVKYAFHLWR